MDNVAISHATMPLPLKVWYLITDLDIGGAQKTLIPIFKRLNRHYFDLTVVCLYGGDGIMADGIRSMGIPIIDLGMTSKWRVDALWRFYRLVRRERPIILHTSLFHASLIGRIVGRLSGTPLIFTWRQNVSIGGGWRERLNRWTSALDDGVVAVSKAVADIEIERARIPAAKVTIVPNCVDLPETTSSANLRNLVRNEIGIGHDLPVIGFIGRLHPQKGLPDLLHALLLVRMTIPSAQLVIVGDGELRAELEAVSRNLGLADVVTFTGKRADVLTLLAAFDLFALPSHWEGLPLVLLEAMSIGLPVVATAVGGVPELVIDGESGFVVPAKDPPALAQAIIQLLERPQQAAQMGRNGRQRVAEQFSANYAASQIEELYMRLLREKVGLDLTQKT
jgi:glycosyltransferase involved in cell wall biosynthesis